MRYIPQSDTQWIEGRGYRKRIMASGELLQQDGALIQTVCFEKGTRVPLHYHEHGLEAFYILSEGGTFVLNGERIVVKKGDVIICEPGDMHAVEDVERDFCILVFKTNWVSDDMVWGE